MSEPSRAVTSDDVTRRIRGSVAALLRIGLETVDTDVPLSAYGIDSKSVMALVVDVEALLSTRVDPDLFLHGRSIDEVGEEVARAHAGSLGPANLPTGSDAP